VGCSFIAFSRHFSICSGVSCAAMVDLLRVCGRK
jgi:hypothetical protein